LQAKRATPDVDAHRQEDAVIYRDDQAGAPRSRAFAAKSITALTAGRRPRR